MPAVRSCGARSTPASTSSNTADMYSRGVSEEIVGRALRDFATRDQVVIATKAFFPMGDGPNDRGLSRKHLFDAIDASLRRLGTDHVDLYQIHRFDPHTPIEGDARGAERHRARRQGAVHRRVEHVRLAVRADAPGFRAAGLGALRVDAEPLQPRLPRGRARDAAAVPRRGHRRHPLEPAGPGLPGRQPRPSGRGRLEGGRDAAGADRRIRPWALLRRVGLPRRRPGGRARPAARSHAGPDCPRLDSSGGRA